MSLLALALILCCVAVSDAGTWRGRWGLGADRSNDGGGVKLVEFGRQRSLGPMEGSLDLGGWTDASRMPGARNSGYVQALVGMRTRSEAGVYAQMSIGPALITSKDSVLGSTFQFTEEAILGLKDLRKTSIFLYVKHFSNAGLRKPNLGRNFVGLGVEF